MKSDYKNSHKPRKCVDISCKLPSNSQKQLKYNNVTGLPSCMFRQMIRGVGVCLGVLLSFQGQAFAPDSLPKVRLIAFPAVVRSIETDWSFGGAGSLTYRLGKDSTTRTANQQLLGLYSIRKQFVLGTEGTVFFPGERFIMYFQGSYSFFPDKFWGLGPNSKESDVEAYIFKQVYLYPHVQRKLWRQLFVGVLYEYQKLLEIDYTPGGIFDRQNVTGRNDYNVSGTGLSATWDSRNHAFVPNRGWFAQILFNHFSPVIGSTYRYTNTVIDTRKYFALGHRHVLAVQAYGFFNKGNVPLRSMAALGGSTSMRGYYDGRYRDRSQVVFQAEYRFPLIGRLGGAAFLSYGDVSPRLSQFDLLRFKYSYGTGLRFRVNPRERLNLRIDYGWGKGKSQGLYFTLGEAF